MSCTLFWENASYSIATVFTCTVFVWQRNPTAFVFAKHNGLTYNTIWICYWSLWSLDVKEDQHIIDATTEFPVSSREQIDSFVTRTTLAFEVIFLSHRKINWPTIYLDVNLLRVQNISELPLTPLFTPRWRQSIDSNVKMSRKSLPTIRTHCLPRHHWAKQTKLFSIIWLSLWIRLPTRLVQLINHQMSRNVIMKKDRSDSKSVSIKPIVCKMFHIQNGAVRRPIIFLIEILIKNRL